MGQDRRRKNPDDAKPLERCSVALARAVKRLSIKSYVGPVSSSPAITRNMKNGVIMEGCTLKEVISSDQLHDYNVSAAKTT